jgi:hypothetical protein
MNLFRNVRRVTPIEPACWRALDCSEAPASCHASAASYRLSKDVGILAVVVAELKFREVKRQIFLADVVIRPDDSALEQSPEGIERLSMNLTAHVLALHVINGHVREHAVQVLIAYVLIGCDQCNFVADCFADESFQRSRGRIFDNLTDDVALARDCADDADLAAPDTSSPQMFALAPMLILFLAADERFVHLNDPHQLLEVGVLHRSSQAMAEIPSGVERRRLAKEHPPNLTCRNALFALEHGVENLEPSQQRNLGVLENGSSGQRETISVAAPAFRIRAFPFPRQGDVVNCLGFPAARTARVTIRPASHKQELATRILCRECFHQLLERHHE